MAMGQMHDKVVMITGANSGIGKAAAIGLAKLGANVVMVCRSLERGQTARTEIQEISGNRAVDLMIADLASQQSIRQFCTVFHDQYLRLDVLVNNAGAIFGKREVTPDGLERTFALNHLGPFLFTHLLLGRLKDSAPSRVINVASGAAFDGTINFDDLQGERGYHRRGAYSQSKLANILFTVEMARRLAGSGVTVNCMNPGNVRTKLTNPLRLLVQRILKPAAYKSLNFRSPEAGADTIVYLASASEVDGITGKFFVDRCEAEAPAAALDVQAARRLWNISAELTAI
jgi:retinol dehydrogenase 14